MSERELIVYQYCLTVGGIVKRSKKDLNICENKNCKGCSPWRTKLDEELTEALNKELKKIEDEHKGL